MAKKDPKGGKKPNILVIWGCLERLQVLGEVALLRGRKS